MPHVVEQVFASPEAMAQTSGRLTALPWPDWAARMRSLDVDGVRADYVEIDPYELEIPPVQDRPNESVRLMLSIILEGHSTGVVDGRALRVNRKQAALLDGRAAMRFRASVPVRAVRLFVEEDHLPAESLRSPSLPFATLKHTSLVTGCVGLITGLLQLGGQDIEPRDEVAVSQPLIALMVGLLDQALHEQGGDAPTSAARRCSPLHRAQIEDYIDRHLADTGLTISSIADAFGVHIRSVHAAFDGGPDTVGALIRARRVLRAQALLVVRDEPPNVAALAARVGLTRTQLTRIFQASTAQTTRQWWEQHRRSG